MGEDEHASTSTPGDQDGVRIPFESTNNDEILPFLQEGCAENGTLESANLIPKRISRRLYLSHVLSTWNSRVFEFGAVLYLAVIFPGTLLPMSIYALSRDIAAILFSPFVGHYVDIGDRLQVVRLSIVLQRIAVAVSCVMFYILLVNPTPSSTYKNGMLAGLAFLACVEKLCAIMNLIAVERDWVVIIAQTNPVALRTLNSQMRRIDLLCKLFGPLLIASVDGVSSGVAILANFAMNVASTPIEYLAIAKVYREVPELQEIKVGKNLTSNDGNRMETGRPKHLSLLVCTIEPILGVFLQAIRDYKLYIRHPLLLASLSNALLYLTVLTFSGQMITFLLASGYRSTEVGIARTVSVAFEVLATWLSPWLMSRIGPIRAGLWFSTSQTACLIAGIAVFWAMEHTPGIAATGLVAGTVASRVGLWGFDLCAQIIVQEDVESSHRGAFSSVEASLQNLFSIISYISTIVFSQPDQFKWPALLSVLAVATANLLYASFVRLRRGHLLHLSRLGCPIGSAKARERATVVELQRIARRGV